MRQTEHCPKLLSSVEIAGRAWPVENLPTGVSLNRRLGVICADAVEDAQVISPYYADAVLTPRAVKAPNGDHLAFGVVGGLYFSPHVPSNQARMWRSTDNGRTWDEGVDPWQMPNAKEHCLVPFVDPQEPARIYVIGNASEDSAFEAPMVLRSSDDSGHTWTEPWQIVPQDDATFPGAPVHMRGGVLSDGTWLWGAYYRQKGNGNDDRQFVLRSTDRGRQWTILPAPHPDGWQHPEWGKFMESIAVPTGGRNAVLYLRAPGGCMYEKRTRDSGLTWSDTAEVPDLVHPDAPPMVFPLTQEDGLIAFIHNRYTAEHPYHYHPDRNALWLATSHDAGQTWSEPRFILAQAKHTDNPLSLDPDVSYVDLLVDGPELHLFVSDGQHQVLYVRFRKDQLSQFPVAADIG